MSGQKTISQPFNNAQLELLKLFADDVPEEDLKAIKELISKYFPEKAKDQADQIWEEKGLVPPTLAQERNSRFSTSEHI